MFLKKINLHEVIFAIFFLIINTLLLKSYVNMHNNHIDGIKLAIIIIGVVIEIILSYILIKYGKKLKIEKIFLLLAIPFGCLYFFAIPLGMVPDEVTHFMRAYEVSEFHILSESDEKNRGGRILPEEVKTDLANRTDFKYSELYENIVNENNQKKFLLFTSASLYSFICYIPQAFGILIGKIFSLPVVICGYFGRLTNFITWLVLLYYSIKLIPFQKKFLLFISLLPIVFQEAISLSPDALTIGISSFLISYVLYLTYRKGKKVEKTDWIILSISSIILSTCKIVYLPICLILFMIPEDKFGSRKDKIKKILLLAFIVVLLNIIWLAIASKFLVEFQEGVNSKEQILFILSHPLSYVQIIVNSIYLNTGLYMTTLFGEGLEWFNVNIPNIFLYMDIVIFGIMVYREKLGRTIIKKCNKYLSIFIVISTLLLIYTSLYIQWNPVGNSNIGGVQGRYFIPLFLFIPLLALSTDRNDYYVKFKKNNYLYLYCIFQNITTISIIIFNHL